MTKLSRREKFLILFLMFILIVGVGMMVVIMPLNDNVTAMKAERDLLQQQEVEMRNKIMSMNKVLENKNKLISDVDALLGKLSDPLMEENFDILTQELATNRHVSIVGLSYGGIQAVAPSATGTPSRRYEYNLMNMIDIYRNYAPEPSKVLATEHQVLKQTVILTINGSYNNLRNFISDINNTSQTVFVHGIGYSQTETITFDDLEIEHKKKVEVATLNIDVYFIEKINSGTGSNHK